MKLFYINDKMFQNDSVQDEVRYRFIKHLQNNRIKMILISVKNEESEALSQFLNSYAKIPVMISPLTFEFEGIRGSISEDTLSIEGYPTEQAIDTGCVEYDLETKCVRHIYFDMCLNHHLEDDFDLLYDEVERHLREKLKHLKHKHKKDV